MINITLNLGKVALAISAEAKADKIEHFLGKGIASEAYRASANKVFGSKGHSRDEAYSIQLASEVEKACSDVLSPNCESLKIETSAKKEGAKKVTVENVLADLGLSMEDVKALQEAKAKAALELVEEEDVIEQ